MLINRMQRNPEPAVFVGRTPAGETKASTASQSRAQVRKRGHRIAEEHHAETRNDQIGGEMPSGTSAASPATQDVLADVRSRSAATASIGIETSIPTTRPEGPTARASSMVVAPHLQPTSIAVDPGRGAANASNGPVTGESVRSRRSWLLVQYSPSVPFQRVRGLR
jgi:hypothetical protein